MKLLEDFDKGKVKKAESWEKKLEEEGLKRSKDDIEGIIRNSGLLSDLPKIVKKSIFSEKDFLATYRFFPAEEPEPVDEGIDPSFNEELSDIMDPLDIKELYKFQKKSIKSILNGEDVVIVAPTGSGKTEAFAIPITMALSKTKKRSKNFRIESNSIKGLFIYPTKALTRDQFPKIRKIAQTERINIDIFDGDTPEKQRKKILESPPDIILTNFDTIHHHMIHRTSFSRLLQNIEYIVVDEVHVYRGAFGSNIHFIIKRLKRYSGEFQIIAASATIRNPLEFCNSLFDRNLSLINETRGKHGDIHFSMIYPILRSHRSLIIDLLKLLYDTGRKTIFFSNSHLGAELTSFYARRKGIQIEVHRSGLLSSWRRKVEDKFRSGDLKCISSTPTLELGIDIGITDSVISELVNWTRLIQRTGRAGRRGQESIVFLALRDNDPISQYYRKNPDDYFMDTEPAFIEPLNPIIAKYQILAASMEKPIKSDEFNEFQSIKKELVMQNLLFEKKSDLIPDYKKARTVLKNYDIRGTGESISIIFQKKKIGERGMPQAFEELYPGAVYFIGGIRYRSIEIDLTNISRRARVERLSNNYPYYTRPLKEDWPIIEKIDYQKNVLGSEVAYCSLEINKKVLGYIDVDIGSGVSRGSKIWLDIPLNYSFQTKGLVFSAPIPKDLLKSKNIEDPQSISASSFHATEHVTIESTNSITGGAAENMGGITLGESGLIFIYDSSRGGNGASRILFDRLEEAIQRGFAILNNCSCNREDGCPRCTYSYRCGNNNESLNRIGAIEVMRRILSKERTKLNLSRNMNYKTLV
jgi:DEAD/DEAH box helicase domain-containing protein